MISNSRFSDLKPRKRGQSLVEFAVALPVLLIILLGLFEAARWFQAYLAVQYAAREASRFAVTGQPPMYMSEGEGSCQEKGIPVTGAAYDLPNDYLGNRYKPCQTGRDSRSKPNRRHQATFSWCLRPGEPIFWRKSSFGSSWSCQGQG